MADGKCQLCCSAPILLHNVPHLGVLTALCTSCLLRHKPGSFCPVCFDIYDDGATVHSHIMCFRCPALVHLTCLPSARSSPAFCYLCPQCSDPSFSFIDSSPTSATFTADSARRYVCAAKIAAACMRRTAALARADAEQKVIGAVAARRKAKEAIQRVAYLMSRDHSDVDDR